MDSQSFNPAANVTPNVGSYAPQGLSTAPAPGAPTPGTAMPGAPIQSAPLPNAKASSDKTKRLIMIIALVIVSLLAATFIGLFVWMYVMWDEAKTDVDGQISKAVAIAENELQTKLEKEFEEKEKYPMKTFAGPADYGSLTFEFPKTWSVYVPADAAYGGNYFAYLNPGLVSVVSDDTINALRVSILNELTENVLAEYQDAVEEGLMTVSVYKINGANASLYAGALPNNESFRGYVAIFKIRDKTVIMQTDAELFKDDFLKILDSVRYNI